jgi:hypothetical protein
MAEEELDGADIGPIFEEVSGVGMAQLVGGEVTG